MQFIQGNNRKQTYFGTLDDQVAADNPVRLMDAFIDKLDLQKLGFQKTVHKSGGRPPYAPGVLLKLYLYGYLNKIRSSGKLEKECKSTLGYLHDRQKLYSPLVGDTGGGEDRSGAPVLEKFFFFILWLCACWLKPGSGFCWYRSENTDRDERVFINRLFFLYNTLFSHPA